jgi:hypothetical protein
MKRTMSLVTVALVMAAMMLVAAMPAFAQGKSGTAPNCEKENDRAYAAKGANHRNQQATDSLDKNYSGPKENGAICTQS